MLARRAGRPVTAMTLWTSRLTLPGGLRGQVRHWLTRFAIAAPTKRRHSLPRRNRRATAGQRSRSRRPRCLFSFRHRLFPGSRLLDGPRDEAAPGPGACTDKRDAWIVVQAPDGPITRKGRAGARARSTFPRPLDAARSNSRVVEAAAWLLDLVPIAHQTAGRPRATGLHRRFGRLAHRSR